MTQIALMHNPQSLRRRRVTLSGAPSCNVERDNLLMKEIGHLQNLSETVKCHTFSKYSPVHDRYFSHLRIHLSNHDLKCFCEILRMVSLPTLGRSSTSSNLLPRSSDFKVGKSQKSDGDRSGEYAGCFIVSKPHSLSVALVTTEEWDGALSWCKRKQPPVFSSSLLVPDHALYSLQQ